MGQQILNLLYQRLCDLHHSKHKLGVNEFFQWVSEEFEGAFFYESDVKSPIVLTSLRLSRLRSFEAVALIGVDSDHLPGGFESSVLSEGVRTQ